MANNRDEKPAWSAESELSEIKKERAKLIKEAKSEAARIVKEANALIENTIREIKESQAEKERTREARKKVETFKTEVESETAIDPNIERKIEQLKEREARRTKRSKERQELKANEPKITKKPVIKPIEVGSYVVLDGAGTPGKVLSMNGKKATVAFGMLSSTVELSRLKISSSGAAKSTSNSSIGALSSLASLRDVGEDTKKSAGSVTMEAAMNFTTQLDIRGMRAADALEKLQRFVDDAIILGQRQVKILHGKGTGALKEEVRRYLRSEPMVKRVSDEHERFGGAGITVVEF